ncbi:hypothetical protein B0H14DRAFT_2580429 [Mycena olivaceomarginata]|nr:hypothetical protein B0H14DRAFT_2580429 [Mycena olivaceomarginata]
MSASGSCLLGAMRGSTMSTSHAAYTGISLHMRIGMKAPPALLSMLPTWWRNWFLICSLFPRFTLELNHCGSTGSVALFRATRVLDFTCSGVNWLGSTMLNDLGKPQEKLYKSLGDKCLGREMGLNVQQLGTMDGLDGFASCPHGFE